MLRWVHFSLALLSVVPPHALSAAHADAVAPLSPANRCCQYPVEVQNVRLNEFLAGPARDWDGSGTFSSRDDEWIEIANTGTTPADLTGFFVTDGDTIPRFAFTGSLAPGAVQLVTGKASYDWEHANSQPAFGLSLSNSGDSVLLWKVAGGDTLLVDGYTFRSFEAASDRSVGRAVGTGEWQLFDSLNPYTGTLTPAGNHCPPTPGTVNICTSVPTRLSTWGSLKATYR